MSVNNYNKRIKALKRIFDEIERNTGSWQCVYQAFNAESELLDNIEAFGLVTDRGHKLQQVPARKELIEGLNAGRYLLLSGILWAFIVPEGIDTIQLMAEFENILHKQENTAIAYRMMQARAQSLWSDNDEVRIG